jgi:hypothetical protein
MRIRVMADYKCWPLWRDEPGDDDPNIDPATLPISNELVVAFNEWRERLDSSLNWEDPAGTKWPTKFWSDFNGRGHLLAERLQQELSPAYEVRQHVWGGGD